MTRKLFDGKGSSMTRRKFDYQKEGVLWRRKFYDDKIFNYEKEVASWKKKFYDEKKA